MPTAAQLLQPAGATLQGSGVQLQGSSPNLQGSSFNPQQTAPAQTLNNTAQTVATFGSTGDVGATAPAAPVAAPAAPTIDPVAAQRAADLAEANQLRGTFTSLFTQINDIYDSIYGRVSSVGAEKAGQVQERYGTETGALAEQFSQEFPQIGNAYAARNAGDSSYRYDAEQQALGQYEKVGEDLSLQRDQDLATTGQYVTNEQAAITADQSKIDIIKTRIAESEDPNELRQLKTEYQNLKADLVARNTGTQSEAALTSQANQLVDTRDRTAALQSGLQSIITGAAPNALKQQVAYGMIEQSGLSPDDIERMKQWFGGQLAPEETEQVQAPVTG